MFITVAVAYALGYLYLVVEAFQCLDRFNCTAIPLARHDRTGINCTRC